jgi:hypothetical protein
MTEHLEQNEPFESLALRYLEDGVSPQQFAALAAMLRDDPRNRDVFNTLCLHARVIADQLAPTLRDELPAAPIAPRSRWRGMVVRHAKPFAIAATFVLLIGAAVSALVISAAQRSAATRPLGPAIASLVDATDAVWEPSDVPTSVGSQLGSGFLRLRSGSAVVAFVSGAEVTLQGPAEFGLNSAKRGFLKHGRIAAYVPAAARGFTIAAPGCAVIDLGTRFEMSVGRGGQSQVRVTQGAVRFETTDAAGKTVTTSQLLAHNVANLDAAGRLSTAEEPESAVAEPNISTPVSLDLVDIVAGGDGLGDRADIGLDPATGGVVPRFFSREIHSDGEYHRVNDRPLIDGVFVPNSSGRVQVTSAGQRFAGFTAPSNNGWGPIWAWGPGRAGANLDESAWVRKVSLGGRLLSMHANAGLTLDLDAARKAQGGASPRRFTAVVQVAAGFSPARVQAWALVDGEPKFSVTLKSGDAARAIDVPLAAGSHYLTLATADAGDNYLFDVVVFQNPVIELDRASRSGPVSTSPLEKGIVP